MTSRKLRDRMASTRSRVSNGSEILAGVDGRSAGARRYRDIIARLTAEMGADLGEALSLQVRTAASLVLHSEELTARMVRGEAVDPEEFSRASNGAIRALEILRRRKPTPKRGGDALAEHLARKAAAS